MLVNGAVVGAVGMLTGAAIGLAGWIALVPHLETIDWLTTVGMRLLASAFRLDGKWSRVAA